MKAEVEYKLTKKMKKRRELDALVDTEKLPRARKSSISAQELLEYHSESSDTEDFSPAPLALRSKKCCLCHQVVVRLGIFMVCIVSLTTCIGLLWVQWHIREQITILTKQVEAVQASKTGSSDLMSLKSQLASINSSVNSMQASTVQPMETRISNVEQKLQDLQTSAETLQKSMAAHQDLIDIPQKFKSLTDDVANVISNVKTSQVNLEKLTQRVEKLENPSKDEQEKSLSVAEENAEKILILEQDIASVNGTLTAQMLLINQAQQEFLNKILDFTGDGSPASTEQIQAMVSEMLANLSRDVVSMAGQQEMQTQQISDLRDTMAQFQKPGEGVVDGDFLAFKQSTQNDFQFVNSSLATLNKEMTYLSDRLAVLDVSVHNLTTVVVAEEPQALDSLVKTTPSSPEPQPQEDNEHEKNQLPPLATETGSDAPLQPASTGESRTLVPPSLKVSGVNTAEDLLRILADLPKEEGQYNATILAPLINDPDGQLTRYDADHNHLYSEQELLHALGLDEQGHR